MAEKRIFRAAYVGPIAGKMQGFQDIWIGKENQWIYLEDENLAKLKKKIIAHDHQLLVTINGTPLRITPLPNEIIFYLRLPDVKG